MIFFDVTQSGASRHQSGLMRVNTRLRQEAGEAFKPVAWPQGVQGIRPDDWFLSTELFSEAERPGMTAWVSRRPCRLAALFHDAIPLRHPDITWPRSVARHPGYMSLLADFDRVFAVSEASRRDLEGFWRWQGITPRARVSVVSLGADGVGPNRAPPRENPPGPLFLSVGILEPRKNQAFLLDVAERLWQERLVFTLHLVGRVNPLFGRPLFDRIRQLQKRFPGRVAYHGRATDAMLQSLYGRARATVFPSLAEGCGLPVLESLWQGVPCVCSDLPSVRENAEGGGCRIVALDQTEAWLEAMRDLVRDPQAWRLLAEQAATRSLPRWADTTAALIRGCSEADPGRSGGLTAGR